MQIRQFFYKFTFLLYLILFSSFAFANQNVTARPSTNGKLHVSGTEIHDQNDNSVILKGVSTHGLAWFPRYINSTLFKQISTEWNANVIRLAMYSEDYVNGNKNRNLQLLRSGIKYAVQSDMYVIVDWHILRDNNPNQYLAEAVGFFNQISKEFATVPNIIYEICNEPNGDCTWEDIKEYASVIIPVIRRHNTDAMILIGTPNYDREIQFAAQDPINIDNIMYTFHFYASSHGAEMQQKLKEVVEGGTPIFISESGICEESGNGRINFSRAKNWYNLADSLNLSYTVWSLSNKEEESAMIKDKSRATDYLADEDLTLSGMFTKTLLLGLDVNQIFFEYGTYSHLRLLWSTKPVLVWLHFAVPVFILLFIIFVLEKIRKRFKDKHITTYDDLLKFSSRKEVKKFNSKANRVFIGDLFLFLSTLTTLIYLCWRVTFSIPFAYGRIAIAGNIILLCVEVLGFIESLIHYSGMLKLRDHPLPKIDDKDFPDVDIFIATYNEPVELLRKTIIGCKYMEYPDKSKVHIYVCDDNRRPQMRALAEELGVNYFDRPNNEGAKAGNLNAALARSSSPYVVTFDADMIPQRKFLLKTIPYFVDAQRINETLPENRRRQLGFIQTPQCFYTPDVFQHNLYTEHTVPNEQDYFYDVIEAAKTSSNSVIYGGSNTILSRKALEDIGGFYTKTITEDFATGMLIETAGYVSLGLSEPLASGIAPSSLAEHVQQRTRWGRGVISTAKQLKFLRNRKLTIAQKFSYLSSVIYWFSPIKNFIYLLAPLMFAVFCIPIFRCNLYDLLLFWFPMHCMQIWSLRITSHGKISTQWSGIHETSIMPFMLVPIIKEAFGITLSKFKVTNKDKSSRRTVVDRQRLIPFAILLGLTLAGIIRMGYLLIIWRYAGILAVLFWLFRNAYYLTMCLFLVIGRDTDDENVKVYAAEIISIIKADGRKSDGVTTKITEHSADVFIDELDFLTLGEPVELNISTGVYDFKLKGTIVSIRHSYHQEIPSVYTVEILDFAGQKDAYVHMLYDRTPTLPQHLRLRDSYIGNLWKNFANRVRKN